jgi:hypothetical protein
MKDTKRKSLIKTAKKTAKKNIFINLVAELKKVSANIGAGSGKLEKVIEKGSNKLAKKIVKEIQLDEAAIVATGKVAKTEKAPVEKTTTVKAESVKPAKSAEKRTPNLVIVNPYFKIKTSIPTRHCEVRSNDVWEYAFDGC